MYRHFLCFASVIHDRLYLINDRHELFDIRVHNQQLIDDLVARGEGAFLIGAHLGSFEVLRAVGRRQPGPARRNGHVRGKCPQDQRGAHGDQSRRAAGCRRRSGTSIR